MSRSPAIALPDQDAGNTFLDWFASQSNPMLESRLRLGALEYFHFASFFDVDGQRTSAHGSDIDRRSAALKCAGETIERQVMAQFFMDHRDRFPRAIRNTNGWAVHTSLERAKEKSMREAIERHLLLKSFFLFGWSGFHHVQSVQSDEISLKFLASRSTANGLVAGLVAAQSPKYAGVSFGYTLGRAGEIHSAEFWQTALFEAVDKFLILNGDPPEGSWQSWIRREVNRFLVEPFCLSELKAGPAEPIEADLGRYETQIFDLSARSGSPLYAAFTYGGNLIPLFWRSDLQAEDLAFVQPILHRNGIIEIPERHPVL